jgi:hypothetical protein
LIQDNPGQPLALNFFGASQNLTSFLGTGDSFKKVYYDITGPKPGFDLIDQKRQKFISLAKVTGIDVDGDETDATFLKVEVLKHRTKTQRNGQWRYFTEEPFNKVPAIVYNPSAPAPLAGQQAVLVGDPEDSYYPVESTGIYMGQYKFQAPSGTATWQVIAIDARSAQQNPCYFEGNGQGAMLADGYELDGPLVSAVTTGYYLSQNATAVLPGVSPAAAQAEFNTVEQSMGVAAPIGATVMCFYAKVSPRI